MKKIISFFVKLVRLLLQSKKPPDMVVCVEFMFDLRPTTSSKQTISTLICGERESKKY